MQNFGEFKWNSRNYEMSLWTLQDSFIATLKGADPEWDDSAPPVNWPLSRQRGRVENAKMTLNMDGTQSLTFDVPMYIRVDGEKVENPTWYNDKTGRLYRSEAVDSQTNPVWEIISDGNLLVSMRKIKVIFNKGRSTTYNTTSLSGVNWPSQFEKDFLPEGYKGNVDLYNRKIIYKNAFVLAGYDNFSGEYGTIYSQTFTGKDEKFVIVVTSVTDEGNVLSQSYLDEYVQALPTSSMADIYAVDKGLSNIVLNVYDVSAFSSVYSAITVADNWAQDLHDKAAIWDGIRYEMGYFGHPELNPNNIFTQEMVLMHASTYITNYNESSKIALDKNEKVFEFLITKITESHKDDNMICSVECEGLAFHELGKVGFKCDLSSEKFLEEYNGWRKKDFDTEADRNAAEPHANLQYWMKQAGIDYVPENEALRNPSKWYYKISMARTALAGANIPIDNHIYEENYPVDWDDDLNPTRYVMNKEMERQVDIQESNIYNITQDLAEKFGVFCKYEFDYDDNYNIKSKTIVFYNNFLTESEGVTTLMYPNTAQEITRSMDSIDITTKMFVRSVDDDTTYSGSINVIDSTANKSMEDYLLNFKYMYQIGTITQDQYDEVTQFEKDIRDINQRLVPISAAIGYLSNVKVDIKAKVKFLENSVEQDNERITETGSLLSQLQAVGTVDSDGYITIDWKDPDVLYLIKDTHEKERDTFYVKFNQNGKLGIDPDTLELYKTYNYGSSTGPTMYCLTNKVPSRCYPTSYEKFEQQQFGTTPEWSEDPPNSAVGGVNKKKYLWTRYGVNQKNGSKTYTYRVQYIKEKDDEEVNEYITSARFAYWKKKDTVPQFPTKDTFDIYHSDQTDKWTSYVPTWDGSTTYIVPEFKTSGSSQWFALSSTETSQVLKTLSSHSDVIVQQATAKEERLTDPIKGNKVIDDYNNLEKVEGLFPQGKYGNYYYYRHVVSGTNKDNFQNAVASTTGGHWKAARYVPEEDTYYMWVRNNYKYWNGYISKSYVATYYKNGVAATPTGESAANYVRSRTPIYYLRTDEHWNTKPDKPTTSTAIANTNAQNKWTTSFPDKPKDGNYKYYYCTRWCTFATSDNTTYSDVDTISASEITPLKTGSSSTSDAPKYIYATYRYKPDIYYENIKNTWLAKLNQDETKLEDYNARLTSLNRRLAIYQDKYETILEEKKARLARFERLMGAALRESYWQPEDEYQNYGTPYHDTLYPTIGLHMQNYQNDKRKRAIYTLSSVDHPATLGFDGYLFEDEEDVYYNYSITEDKRHYPMIDLRKIPPVGGVHFLQYCQDKLDKISLYFCPTANIPADADLNDVRYMKQYLVGSEAKVGFLWQGTNIIPIMYFDTADGLSDEELTRMKEGSYLGVVTTTEGTVSLTITCANPYTVPTNAWITINDVENAGLVYPRIKIESLALKKDDEDLIIKYKKKYDSGEGVQLQKFEQFYIFEKNYYLEKDEDTVATTDTVQQQQFTDITELTFADDETDPEDMKSYKEAYTITIKPEFLLNAGLPLISSNGNYDIDYENIQIDIYYSLSNAATDIYIDAYNILKENAYPKVSYTVNSIPLNTEFSNNLYNKLAQVIMINDTDLKFENTFGYISQVELDLDDLRNDTIEVKNYKTKFEDLFSKIVAETEEMHKNSRNIGLAGALGSGGMVNASLSVAGFSGTIKSNSEVLAAFLDEYFDDSAVVQAHLQSMWNEAGDILSSALTSLTGVVGLTTSNANTLAGFRENVTAALTPTVFSGPVPPSAFKAGDIWLNTDNGVDTRSVAIGGSANGGNFVTTYDGKLAEIAGANVAIDANKGTIDITGETYINLSSGKTVTIAANDTVEIIGNRSVNIGGTTINIASTRIFDGNESKRSGGIHLVASVFQKQKQVLEVNTEDETETISYTSTLNSMSYVDITGEGIELGAKDGIIIKSGGGIDIKSATQETLTNEVYQVSAIRINGQTGIFMGSTAPLKFYSGDACNVFYGPYHGTKFEKGDYWYKTPISNNQSNLDQYGNQKEASSNYYQINNIRTGEWYRAEKDWTEVYGTNAAAEELSKTNKGSTNGWYLVVGTQPNIVGADVEISSEHIVLGVADISQDSATAIEMNKDEIILAAGKNLSAIKYAVDSQGKKMVITEIPANAAITGMQMQANYIGMATGVGSERSILSLKPGKIQIGQMTLITDSNGQTGDPDDPESYEGSYVWLAKDEIYIGTLGHFTLNTNNVKLQTKTEADVNTSMTNPQKMGFCLGKNLQGLNGATPDPCLGFWIDPNGNAHLVVNGEITADRLTANGTVDQEGNRTVFIVDGGHLGIYKFAPNVTDVGRAERLLYFENGNLHITGHLHASGIWIDEGEGSYPWGSYWSTGVGTSFHTAMQELMGEAGEILAAAAQSLTDVTNLNTANYAHLATFYETIKTNLTPDTTRGTTHPAKFKTGDIWIKTNSNNELQGTYMAMQNWDEVYSSVEDANAGVSSDKGWNRTEDGRLANIQGADLKIDAASGLVEITAQHTMNLLCNGTIDISGNDVSITGSRTLKLGGPSIELGAAATAQNAVGHIKLIASASGGGTTYVNIASTGLEIASANGIEIKSGAGIKIYYSDGSHGNTAAIEVSESAGVYIGSGKSINLSSSTSEVVGTNFAMSPERLLMGATASTSASAIDIRSDSIVMAVGNRVGDIVPTTYDIESGEYAGLKITKDYIGLAVGTGNARGLISMNPNKMLIGIGAFDTSTGLPGGSYIRIYNDTTNKKTIMDVASSGRINIEANSLWIGGTPYQQLHDPVVMESIKVYCLYTATTGLTSRNAGDQTWYDCVPNYTNSGSAEYVWSATRRLTYAGMHDPSTGDELAERDYVYEYTKVTYEGKYTELATVSHKEYAWNNNSSTAPADSYDTCGWSLEIPDNIVEGTTYSYLWERTVTVHLNGGDDTYSNKHRIQSADGLGVGGALAFSIASGSRFVPHVETTGISIYNGSINITAQANTTIAVNGHITIEKSGQNDSVVTLNEDGISLGSSGDINMFAGGKIRLGAIGDNATDSNSMVLISKNGVRIGTSSIAYEDVNEDSNDDNPKLQVYMSNFRLTKKGKLQCRNAVIGDWNVSTVNDAQSIWRKPSNKEFMYLHYHNNSDNENYAINAGNNFWVGYDGTVWMNKLAIYDPDQAIPADAGTRRGDYMIIDFSSLSFKQAVAVWQSVSGNRVTATARIWGKMTQTASSSVTFTLVSVTRGTSYAAGWCDISVECRISVAGGSISSGTLTGKTVNVSDIWNAGWSQAVNAVNYVSPNKFVTVPTGSSAAAGQWSTKTLDISGTWNDGYSDGYSDGWTAALAACTEVTDAYHAGTQTTETKSWSTYCGAAGTTHSGTVSFTYTPQGTAYTGIYKKPSGGGGGGGCFVAGTPVLLDNGHILSIEKLQVGMFVMSYDAETDTYLPAEVIDVSMYKHKKDIVDLHLSSGEIITATKSHPFLTEKGWAAVDPEMSKYDQHYVDPIELHEGDTLVNIDKETVYIEKIVERDELWDETVYNCAVEKYNTFIVKGVVVHNAKSAT